MCIFYDKKNEEANHPENSCWEYFRVSGGTGLKDLDFNVKLEDSLFKVREPWKSDDPPPKKNKYTPNTQPQSSSLEPHVNFLKYVYVVWLWFLSIKNAWENKARKSLK